jgi:hypothetical protein
MRATHPVTKTNNVRVMQRSRNMRYTPSPLIPEVFTTVRHPANVTTPGGACRAARRQVYDDNS